MAGQTDFPAFPVTSGALQSSYRGGVSDCFISKLNPLGSALVYSTFLGGGGLDSCSGIAVDASGNAYVAGTTYSFDFPVFAALQSALAGTANGFVAKIGPGGSALAYSTYLGGSLIDNANAIVVDSTGAAYIAGDTRSQDFPTTAGVFQNKLNGLYNAFAAKLSPSGSSLVYSTFIGGSGSDVANSIAIDATGKAIIGGYTNSSNFPTENAIQPSFEGAFDGFAAVLNPTGSSLVFSSYFGGSGDDRGYAVAAAPNSALYLAGIISSSNFPVASPDQSALSTAPDAFALKAAYVGGTPTTVSVTPNSGSGPSQTFALVYSDTGGTISLQQAYMLFDARLAIEAGSCLLYYNVATNQINLLNDNVTAWITGTPGSTAVVQNSQCSANMAATSVSLSGNTLTINLAVGFAPGYAGAKGIYMYCSDVSGANSAWQQRGSWTASAIGTPSIVSVTPSSGSGAIQTFALKYSDNAGASSLQTIYAWFAPSLSSEGNSCFLYYIPATNQVGLLNDSVTAWLVGTPGGAGAVQNSQCAINTALTTVSLSGNTLTLSLALTLLPSYGGTKSVYMYASDVSGSNSEWQQRGAWTVPTTGTAATVSASPSSGSGLSQTFALTYSDTAGASSLQAAYAWFAPSLSAEGNSCFLYYSPATNQIGLLNDSVTAWLAGAPSTSATLQNSQCSANLATTSVVRNGGNLTLNLAMTFKTAYAGAKNIYMYANDVSGSNSGWQQRGGWTVP